MESNTGKVEPSSRGYHDYGAFQNDIYHAGHRHNRVPLVTTDPTKLEAQARKHLGERPFNYVAGGAGEGSTLGANRLAFRNWKIIPRMLKPTTPRSLKVELFGDVYGLSEACSQIDVPYILSTASTSTIEEVAAASRGGRRWFQLYWPNSDDLTISLLNRAADSGFEVLVVTLDTWTMAWRPADLDNAFLPFLKGVGNQVGFSDPVFSRNFKSKYKRPITEDIGLASEEWVRDVFSGTSPSWDRIALLKRNRKGPIVLKGVQHIEDAKLALKAGCDGIIVSNHGGRQLDGAVGSLEMLPEIADAVGDKMTVPFDSGIRTGADIIKALCLRAKAVLVGRPAIYGLAIGGKEGAKQVLQGILCDLDRSMGLAGTKAVKDCNRSILRGVL